MEKRRPVKKRLNTGQNARVTPGKLIRGKEQRALQTLGELGNDCVPKTVEKSVHSTAKEKSEKRRSGVGNNRRIEAKEKGGGASGQG